MKKMGLILALLVFIADQVSKYFAVKHLDYSAEVTSFFNLSLAYNKGISFGLFNNFSFSSIVNAKFHCLSTSF